MVRGGPSTLDPEDAKVPAEPESGFNVVRGWWSTLAAEDAEATRTEPLIR